MLERDKLSNINSLTILYEDKATSNKEKIVYRYNLVTEEEKTKIDNNLKIPFLKGDADKDGVLTQNDVITLQNAINNIRDNLDYTFIETTCDLDNNGNITLDDKQILEEYLAGTGTLYK